MSAELEVRDMLEAAAMFARGGDLTGGISLASHAAELVGAGPDVDDLRGEVELAVERLKELDRGWRDEIAYRAEAHAARERSEAGVASPTAVPVSEAKREHEPSTAPSSRAASHFDCIMEKLSSVWPHLTRRQR